jgi:hypothetical protein
VPLVNSDRNKIGDKNMSDAIHPGDRVSWRIGGHGDLGLQAGLGPRVFGTVVSATTLHRNTSFATHAWRITPDFDLDREVIVVGRHLTAERG